MILVDTSAWIEFFRGDGACADRVGLLLESDEVALCGPVLTEIRRGLIAGATRSRVLDLLSGCHLLPQPADLWEDAGDLGAIVRKRGRTIKSLDLLIATYALAHSVEILTTDGDFTLIQQAGIGLRLAPGC